jgi:sigma-B regulation protein RsbU (phosphoserine phosphatase)
VSDASQDNEVKALKARIAALEAELQDRERDLSTYRDELQKANRKLESLIENMAAQLQLASQIQKRLVPTEFPNIPGLEFSTKFEASAITGGDYFDIFEHEDRFRFGIVVASSSGYSMSSLFLSVLLRMTGRAEGRRATSPFRFVERSRSRSCSSASRAAMRAFKALTSLSCDASLTTFSRQKT